eukprot:49308_1
MYAHLDSPGRDSHQQLQIFVRSQSFHGTTVINIEKNTTIADVKLTIEDQQGIPAAQQRLTHDGTTLKDHFTLAHYQLQSEQTLILHLKIPRPNAKSVTAPASVSIVVEQLNGNGFTLKRAQTDTIRTLKAEIERKYGIQIDHQCLLLNDMELNDESTVDDNSIKSQTILKLVFSSYHKYKSEQQSVVNNMNPESVKVSVILERTVKNLNDILSKSRSCIGSASSLSSLNRSMTPNVFHRIASEMDTLNAHCDGLRQRTNEAKKIINDNHENVVSEFRQEWSHFMVDINNLDGEINTLNRQIEALLSKRKHLQGVKAEKCSFFEGNYDAYENAYQSIKDQNCTDLDAKVLNIESLRAAVHVDIKEYGTQLKETLNEKMVFFEKQYEKWDVLDVMEWIKTIEDGYFGDKRFETFINVLKEMEVNGPMLPEINNNLFLKATAGLKQESERHILRKHVNRIVANVKHANDAESHNMCGLCIENTINTVNLPCGHCYTCYQCSQREQITQCQICRKDVLQIVQTFISGVAKLNESTNGMT